MCPVRPALGVVTTRVYVIPDWPGVAADDDYPAAWPGGAPEGYAAGAAGAGPRAAGGSFVCARCGRAYKHLPSLRNHVNMECGIERKFACSFCDYRARHKHHLYGHLKSKHGALLQHQRP